MSSLTTLVNTLNIIRITPLVSNFFEDFFNIGFFNNTLYESLDISEFVLLEYLVYFILYYFINR